MSSDEGSTIVTSTTTSGRRTRRNPIVRIIKKNLLVILIVTAIILGTLLGTSLRSIWRRDDYKNIYYLEFPGRIFMNMLKLVMLPLIVSSIVSGMACLELKTSGRLGTAALTYYLSTTFFAVVLGIFLVLIIHPGSPKNRTVIKKIGLSSNVDPVVSVLDLISQLFPDNLITACFERVITKIVKIKTVVGPESLMKMNGTSNMTYVIEKLKPLIATDRGMNVLGLVMFSITFGFIISYIGEDGVPLKEFFKSLNHSMMVFVKYIIWYTPIGVFCLIASKFIATEDIGNAVASLALYALVIFTGLFIHGVFVLPLIYFITTGKNPLRFAFKLTKSLLTAWGTASSAATLPVTMECLIRGNKLNIEIVRFVVPIGATVNMDGTALYEAVACIFIAQVNEIPLSLVQVIIISLAATAGAIGAAGIPQAGLVTLVIVLTAVGLPPEDISLILSIDWFLDRFRTVINVWGDCIGAGILNSWFGHEFSRRPYEMPDAFGVDHTDLDPSKREEIVAMHDVEPSNGSNIEKSTDISGSVKKND